MEIDLHFVQDRVALGEAKVLHVPTTSQFADIFTKGLQTIVFSEFRSSLNVLPTAVPTAGEGGVLNCTATSLYICNGNLELSSPSPQGAS